MIHNKTLGIEQAWQLGFFLTEETGTAKKQSSAFFVMATCYHDLNRALLICHHNLQTIQQTRPGNEIQLGADFIRGQLNRILETWNQRKVYGLSVQQTG